MNSMEFNKIAGATIGALLVFLLLNFFSGMIYGTRGAGHAEDGEHGPVLAYAVAIEAEGGAHGAAEEPQIDLLALFQGADPAAGEKAFRACGACHAVEPGVNKVGPSLHGVVGQDIAAVDGFAYSDAMAAEEGTWTPSHLFAFLGDPKGVVPGTKMSYAGMAKHEDRANVITYLNQTGGAPVDLTEGIEPLAPAGEDHAAAAGGTEVAATGDAPHGTAPAEAAPAADATGSTQGAAGTGGQGAVEHGTAPVVTTPQSSTETTSSSVTGQQEVTVTAVETVDPSKDNVDVTSTTPLQIVEKTPVPEGATGAGPAEQPAGQGTAEQPATATEQPQTQAMLQATQDAVTQQPAQPSAEAASADQTAPAAETPAAGTGTGEQVAAAPVQPAAQPSAPAATEAALAGGDAASGEKVFRRCAACHKLEPGANGIGPSLAGVVGRDIAAVEGYNYSDAMAAHEGTWTPELLSQYLEDPKGTIPGNKMAFTGLKKEKDRIDVITYMQQAGQ